MERPHIHLVPSRFIGRIRDPAAVRRESRIRLIKRRAKEEFRLARFGVLRIAHGLCCSPHIELSMTAVGSSEPTVTPGVFHITEIQIITGGTGRFAGAKGSFTVERLVDLTTLLSSGSFHGTITSPGAAH